MAPPPKKPQGGKQEEKPYTYFTVRNIGFGVAYFLLFCLTAADLGIVAHILHSVGNPTSRYPTAEFKHALGLVLFNVLFIFLNILGTFHLNTFLIAFFMLAGAVMHWTAAGIFYRVVPYKTYAKHNRVGFAAEWSQQPWIGWAKELIALQGISWAAGAVCLALMIGILVNNLELHVIRTAVWDLPPPKEEIKNEKV